MSAHASDPIPPNESNVELLAMDAKPPVQEANSAATTQLEVPGAQKPGLNGSIQASTTLSKSGTFTTRSISDALATEAELESMKRRERVKKLFELSVVIILILVVWVLMFLPTIFFHIDKVRYMSHSICCMQTLITPQKIFIK